MSTKDDDDGEVDQQPDFDENDAEIRSFYENNSNEQDASVVSINDIDCPILRDLNPSQLQAVTQPVDSISRVVAGPGSGKTRVLTSRIAYLLQQTSSSSSSSSSSQSVQTKHGACRILGVTFTRKAAGEMQDRLEKLVQEQAAWHQQRTQPQPSSLVLQPPPPQRRPPPPSSYNDEVMVEEQYTGSNQRPSYHEYGLDRVTLGTFHSVCAKILRWNGELLATLPSIAKDLTTMTMTNNDTTPQQQQLDHTFTILDEGAQLRILKDCLEELDIDLSKYELRPRPVLSAFAQIKALQASGQDPSSRSGRPSPNNKNNEKQPLSKAMNVALKVYPVYREKLLTTNCLDFDDLIFLTRELLLEYKDVREHLQRRWTHVLVDEFQDTSQTQMDLVKLLTSSSLLVVGDADQSIYSWRGANVESLSQFEQEFEHHPSGVQTIYLMENYR